MGFKENTPENQALVKFIEATKPKPKEKSIDIVDLVSPMNSPNRDTIQNQNEVLFVIDTQNQKI